MRLIDADAIRLPKGFFEAVDNVPKFYDWLNQLPTVDTEPVRHGRWKLVDEAEPRRYGCSECRTLSWYGVYNYCPNCGAKMDEGEEDASKIL